MIFPWLFLGGPGYDGSRSFKEAWDLGHVLLFFLLTIELEQVLRPRISIAARRGFFTLSALLAAAVLIEILQSLFPDRMVSVGDIIYSMAGATIALFWIWSSGRSGKRKFFLFSIGFFILAVVATPLCIACLDEYRANRDFPLLADFESSLELSRWGDTGKLKRVGTPVKSGNWSVAVSLGIDKYSGVGLHYFPGNWKKMRGLRFQVFNPDEPVTLHYRVHDIEHKGENQRYESRYNGSQVLSTGWNHVVIPVSDIKSGPRSRKIDLSQVRGFAIFLVDNPRERVLYIDRVELF